MTGGWRGHLENRTFSTTLGRERSPFPSRPWLPPAFARLRVGTTGGNFDCGNWSTQCHAVWSKNGPSKSSFPGSLQRQSCLTGGGRASLGRHLGNEALVLGPLPAWTPRSSAAAPSPAWPPSPFCSGSWPGYAQVLSEGNLAQESGEQLGQSPPQRPPYGS